MSLVIDFENVVKGRPNNNYSCELFRLIFKADIANRAKLYKAYPLEVAMYQFYMVQCRLPTEEDIKKKMPEFFGC